MTNSDQLGIADGLSGRYRIIKRLGAGGMGSVFLAEQTSVKRLVAIKVLSRELLSDPQFITRFQNEATAAGRIRDPHVVTIYDASQSDDGSPYIAMEYLAGESLAQSLRARGPLAPSDCAPILWQIAQGLNAVHKAGIIHRDVKPANILLTQDSAGTLLVKVVDFGIARVPESAFHTKTGTIIGTFAYMSPEQASGGIAKLDERSDVYSLGAVAYEMLVGCVPFPSESTLAFLRKLLDEDPAPFKVANPGATIPAALESIVMKALAKKPEERFPSVLEFAQDFVNASADAQSAIPLAPFQLNNLGALNARQTADHSTTVQMTGPPIVTFAPLPRTRALDQIKRAQLDWADRARIAYDKSNGRTMRVNDNFFAPLGPETLAEFMSADGNELGVDGSAGKISSLHSSSALVCNVFDIWRRRPLTPLLRALAVENDPNSLRFEQRAPTGLRGKAPNLDLLISGDSGTRVTAIECKFTEPFTRGDRGGFSPAYFRDENLWSGLENCRELAEANKSSSKFRHLDIGQLLKHILGLHRNLTHEGFELLYLWYDLPGNAEASQHRREVEQFSQLVSHEVHFRSMTYQELFCVLRVSIRGSDYAKYLVERYFPAQAE